MKPYFEIVSFIALLIVLFFMNIVVTENKAGRLSDTWVMVIDILSWVVMIAILIGAAWML
jgi:hypothetical protein